MTADRAMTAGARAEALREYEGKGAGVAFALTAVLLWGSQFPAAKSLFATLDPVTMSVLRYGIAAAGFLLVLRIAEGPRAFRYEGRAGRATVAGLLGIGMGVVVVYIGLEHAQATSAALVVATQPLIVAAILRVAGGQRLMRATRATIGVAFVGVLLVITHGSPSALVDGRVGWGIGLVFVGQVGWVVYTIDSVSFPGWSPLRYTALTAVPAVLVLIPLTVLFTVAGVLHPSAREVFAKPWLLTYVVVGPAFLAALTWNSGRARLGAQHTVLFLNLVPVVTFAIEIVQGYRVRALECVGALLTIAALLANNALQRRGGGAAAVVETASSHEPP